MVARLKRIFRDDRERTEFLFQLASLLEGGYPLSEAVPLYECFSQGAQKEWLKRVTAELQQGGAMADALAEAGFTKEIVSSLRFAEKYGDFQEGLFRAARILEKRAELKAQMKSVLHYPAFLLLGFVIVIGVLVQGVIPRFDVFFDSMGQDLPWITRFILRTFQFTYMAVAAGAFLFILIILFSFRKKSSVEQWEILLKIPFANSYFQSFLTYYFLAQLSPLLVNGFSLRDGLKTLEEEALHDLYRSEAVRINALLRQGEKFSRAVGNAPYYISQLQEVIEIGESKGRLGDELERFAQYLFSRMYNKTYERLRWFQPLFFTVIGGVVLLLFTSMMMPVFTMIEGL